MRVGLVAPPWVTVPPRGYGGTEIVIDNLARGLAERGHDVELFTVGGSTCPVRRHRLYDEPYTPMNQSLGEAAHVLAAYDALAGVDIVHDHTLLGPLVVPADQVPVPVVVTNHGPFHAQARRVFARVARHAAVIAISHDQAGRAGEVPVAAVIHHGIDLTTYHPGHRAGSGDHLVFIGRMSPDKGVHRAVRIARAAGRPLRIVTKMREPDEREYFHTQVRPLLGRDELPPEELDPAARVEALRTAAALINPITWSEPFGLVMAEALATGTPVIAFDHGAAREIVTDGVTGFLVAGEDEAVEAVGRLWLIDRTRCRQDAVERFSAERMARDHEDLYRRVLAAAVEPPAWEQDPVGGRFGAAR